MDIGSSDSSEGGCSEDDCYVDEVSGKKVKAGKIFDDPAREREFRQMMAGLRSGRLSDSQAPSPPASAGPMAARKPPVVVKAKAKPKAAVAVKAKAKPKAKPTRPPPVTVTVSTKKTKKAGPVVLIETKPLKKKVVALKKKK